MTQTNSAYGFGMTLQFPLEQAVDHVMVALKQQGFGVLTTLDVRSTMKQKLDWISSPTSCSARATRTWRIRRRRWRRYMTLAYRCHVMWSCMRMARRPV